MKSRLICVAIACSALFTAACGGSGSTPPPGPLTVILKNIAFKPSRLGVKVGDRVTFVWKDGAIPHNVDGASDLPSFSSGNPKTGGTWSYTFSKPGTYAYHCDVHAATMTGEITVS